MAFEGLMTDEEVQELKDERDVLRARLEEAADMLAEAGKIIDTPAGKRRWIEEGK